MVGTDLSRPRRWLICQEDVINRSLQISVTASSRPCSGIERPNGRDESVPTKNRHTKIGDLIGTMNNIENTQSTVGDLVVVGASAGGIEALSILVSTLPTDFPAPIVLAQHLDPNRPSNLDHILQRRTTLPVILVTSSSKLEPGKVYVVPANRHILVKDHHVEVQEDRPKRPRPSIDALLSSAAEVYGDRLIAVVLTGSGSDGAVGAVNVKNAGGTVIVQDPHTARYPSMPLALPPTIVDFEVNVENIGPLLSNLLSGATIVQTEEHTEDTLHEILELVNRQASVDFRQYKTSTILRRIGRRMTVTHVHTTRDYVEYLRSYPEEIGELVKAFLINVTQFFRDTEAFAYIRHEILTKLIEKARERDKVLRFWTAGCATGEEPYSLAMLLSDMLGTELSEWSIKIFATDLDEAAITFARRGIYSESLLKGMPNEYRDRFFEHVDQGYRISKMLRQMVIFGQQDLSRSAPFPRIDLVLCRNVLIYFSPELQEYVLNQFAFSLSPDGYLFLGKAETVRPAQSYLELVNKQWKVYRCTGNVLPSVRRQRMPELATPRLEGRGTSRPNKSMTTSNEQDTSLTTTEFGQLRRFNELLLRFLPIGVVVIDRTYRVLTANSAARRLLGLRDVINDQDFLHAVRGIPYATTRTAIDAVFRERNAVTLSEIELEVASGGNGRFLSLSMALMQIDVNTSEFAAISVSDVTEQVQIRRQLEAAQTEQEQLMNELGTTNKRISYVNKELMDANEELQVANEELMLTHEELQATVEEFETTNEELQATNEELETNNEELQATNEELETTNDELRARTNELQELAQTLDSERVRLAEIVELAPFYILVLRGPNLIVEAFNPSYAHMLESRVPQGHPVDEVMDLFWETQLGMKLIQQAHEVYQRDEIRTLPSTHTGSYQQNTQEESYFVYTLVPSHDIQGHVNGVIIYALDETEQHIREATEERKRLKLIFDNTSSALLALYDITTTKLLIASPNYLATLTRAYGSEAGNEIGSTWHENTIVTPYEQAEAIWNTAQETHTSIRLPEVSYTFAQDGRETIWDYTLTPIMDTEQTGMIRFMLVSMVDITEQVQARRELERLDGIKDDFLSLTTHELRTPLTTILGNAQILLRSLKKHATQLSDKDSQRGQFEQWVNNLDRIVYQTNKMNAMIGEMTDVTRLSGKVFELHTTEGVDIVELIRRAIELHRVADENKHPIEFTASTDAAIGTVDAARVEQVLNNLVSNALKYSPAGKPVNVSLTYATDTTDLVIVAVRDEGYGISEEEQEHIFDRFYRASTHEKADGLGLGLYIAHEIVIQQGGRMWLESTPNVGSTFYFSLPLSPSVGV